jgi:putative heme transporter
MSIMPCPAHRNPHQPAAPLDPPSDLESMPPLTVVAPEDRSPAAPVSAIPGTIATGTARSATSWRSAAKLWTGLAAFAILGLVVYTLRDKLPSVHSVSTAITSADVRWVLVAALMEAISMAMFARQQRELLKAMSVRMSMARAIGVTYARSAIAISMPAGSAVSAAFAFQQYRRSGASRDTAAAVMILSGVVSFFGLAALYVFGIAGVVVTSPTEAWHRHAGLIIAAAVTLVATLAILVVLRRRRLADPRPSRAALVVHEPSTGVRRWTASTVASVRRNVASWRTVRPRHWALALAFAALNWLTDLLCLVAAARAFALPVGLFTLASIYLGVQLVRQIPVTPGGIGLIETGLLAGLATAGATTAAAAAVVLTYRLLSCWLIIPIGGASWLGLRARPGSAALPATRPEPVAAANGTIREIHP